jgi:hypothetical protein
MKAIQLHCPNLECSYPLMETIKPNSQRESMAVTMIYLFNIYIGKSEDVKISISNFEGFMRFFENDIHIASIDTGKDFILIIASIIVCCRSICTSTQVLRTKGNSFLF